MERFLNKALLYKEWQGVKLYALFLSAFIFFTRTIGAVKASDSVSLGVFRSELSSPGGMHPFSMAMIIACALIAVFLMAQERTTEYYNLTASMPFKRDEIFRNKWLLGILMISGAFLVNYIIINLFLLKASAALEFYQIGLKWFVLNTFTFLAVFSLHMLAQTLMGTKFSGFVMGMLVLFFPSYVGFLISSGTSVIGQLFGMEKMIDGMINKITYYITLYNYNDVYETSLIWRSIILGVIIYGFYYLAIKAFRKNDFEKIGYPVMLEPIEKVYKSLFSIWLGPGVGMFVLVAVTLIVALIVDKGMNMNVNIRLNNGDKLWPELIGLVSCIGGMWLVYFVSGKILASKKSRVNI